ncbi:hypothetical protein CEXT_342111 [Caerostris extrusa]|uniref:Uncharacterized protein n=1 Tax=Caerostris extrusa TaxID=172846 RepID=A0AAV4TNG5_CAEEX|nr:hypothetical protein CEXT_342111 [Caerostris extrusa]
MGSTEYKDLSDFSSLKGFHYPLESHPPQAIHSIDNWLWGLAEYKDLSDFSSLKGFHHPLEADPPQYPLPLPHTQATKP